MAYVRMAAQVGLCMPLVGLPQKPDFVRLQVENCPPKFLPVIAMEVEE